MWMAWPSAAFSSFHDGLAEGRVRMHVARDFGGGQFHLLRQGQLGQQFGDIWPYQMRA
jgi:hypothetical protein